MDKVCSYSTVFFHLLFWPSILSYSPLSSPIWPLLSLSSPPPILFWPLLPFLHILLSPFLSDLSLHSFIFSSPLSFLTSPYIPSYSPLIPFWPLLTFLHILLSPFLSDLSLHSFIFSSLHLFLPYTYQHNTSCPSLCLGHPTILFADLPFLPFQTFYSQNLAAQYFSNSFLKSLTLCGIYILYILP